MTLSITPHITGLLLGFANLVNYSAAEAATITPINSAFHASGPTYIAVGPIGYSCHATLVGDIDGLGNAGIHGPSSRFEGTTPACTVTLGIDQWILVPTSPTTADLRNVTFELPGWFECTGDAAATLVDGVLIFHGELEADNGNVCRFSGELRTTPTIGISWP